MKKVLQSIFSLLFMFFLSSCSNSDEINIIGDAQYIEHGGIQLYDGEDEYGVIYIYLGDHYSIGNTESYKIEDISIEDSENGSPIFQAEDFNFKKGLLCIPLNNSAVSVGDTLLFKHKHNKIGYLEVVAVENNSSNNLSSVELDKYK